MIIDLLTAIYISMLNLVVLLLPTWSIPASIQDAFLYFYYWIAGITMVIPALSAVWTVLFLMVFFKLTKVMINLAFGFAALIRGSGHPQID